MLRALFFFVEFNKSITRTYPDLFPQQVHMEGAQAENNFNAHWGWYQAISTLSEDKVWKIDDITCLSLLSCLNHLSYLIDKNREQERLSKIKNR